MSRSRPTILGFTAVGVALLSGPALANWNLAAPSVEGLSEPSTVIDAQGPLEPMQELGPNATIRIAEPWRPPGSRSGWGTGNYEMRTSPNAVDNETAPVIISPMGPAIPTQSGSGNGWGEILIRRYPTIPTQSRSGNGWGEILIRRITTDN